MVRTQSQKKVWITGGTFAMALLACESAASAQTRPTPPNDVAIARAGSIPGLGKVSGSIGWDNRVQLRLDGGDFELARSFDPQTREVTIQISGRGEQPLIIRFGGADGFSASRGVRLVRGAADTNDLRALLGGRAIAALREQIGSFERRLMAAPTARQDDPHAYGFFLAGALVSSLAGDPAAVGRARDLIVRRSQGRVQAVRLEFRKCVQEYERYLLEIDEDRSVCIDAANGRDSWYARAADRFACELEFMAGALSGEGQFISCTALGTLL